MSEKDEAQTVDMDKVVAEHGDMAERLTGLATQLGERGYELPAEGEVTAFAIATIDALREQLAKQDVLLAAAKKKAAKAVPSTNKGRKAGPMQSGIVPRQDDDKGEISANAVLLEMIHDAEEVEVVFSDGRKEIATLPALEISGDDAFMLTEAGVKLTVDPIHLLSPTGPVELCGYGLFLDGKQVAWRDTGPHRLQAGQQWNMAGDIVFTA